jgi:hypothetical protein
MSTLSANIQESMQQQEQQIQERIEQSEEQEVSAEERQIEEAHQQREEAEEQAHEQAVQQMRQRREALLRENEQLQQQLYQLQPLPQNEINKLINEFGEIKEELKGEMNYLFKKFNRIWNNFLNRVDRLNELILWPEKKMFSFGNTDKVRQFVYDQLNEALENVSRVKSVLDKINIYRRSRFGLPVEEPVRLRQKTRETYYLNEIIIFNILRIRLEDYVYSAISYVRRLIYRFGNIPLELKKQLENFVTFSQSWLQYVDTIEGATNYWARHTNLLEKPVHAEVYQNYDFSFPQIGDAVVNESTTNASSLGNEIAATNVVNSMPRVIPSYPLDLSPDKLTELGEQERLAQGSAVEEIDPEYAATLQGSTMIPNRIKSGGRTKKNKGVTKKKKDLTKKKKGLTKKKKGLTKKKKGVTKKKKGLTKKKKGVTKKKKGLTKKDYKTKI